MRDPFLSRQRVFKRLLGEYRRYGNIIIAYDFDYTVHNFRNENYEYNEVIELLRKWRPYAKLVVFSASPEERYEYIRNYLESNGIPYDAINEDVLAEKRPSTRKIYYNIFLDDRAGLAEAYDVLCDLYEAITAEYAVSWREVEINEKQSNKDYSARRKVLFT